MIKLQNRYWLLVRQIQKCIYSLYLATAA